MASDTAGMVPVYTAAGQLPAEVIRTKLEAAGIPVLLRYESLGVVVGLTVDGLGEVTVLVPAAYAEEARALLEESPLSNGEDQEEYGSRPGLCDPGELE